MMVSIMVSMETERVEKASSHDPIEMEILDVRRAHFYAWALRRLFVNMPDEDPRYNGEDKTAELKYSLHGTQDAAGNWEYEYAKALE